MADDLPSLPVEPGTVLCGKYRIDEVIASGGMGVVASGFHVALSQPIAVKFLRVWTPDGAARFAREARACAKIANEHIIRVLDVDSLPNGAPFMIMELLEGTDLSVLLKERGRFPIDEAVDYVLQACEALAEAHRNGIIHRDLKPANLFLTQRSDGSPLIKVLDFGISKILASDDTNPVEELTTTNALIGSPSYMSPEQLRAARNADARSDVWALGAVLYKLVAGRMPFVAPSTPDLCIQILTGEVPPIVEVDVPEAFFGVVLRCLEKDRDKRFANVGELAEALRPWSSATVVDRVVRTLGVQRRERTISTARPAADAAQPDTRLATTVDPSVSEPTRSRPAWRLPVVVGAVLGCGAAAAFALNVRFAHVRAQGQASALGAVVATSGPAVQELAPAPPPQTPVPPPTTAESAVAHVPSAPSFAHHASRGAQSAAPNQELAPWPTTTAPAPSSALSASSAPTDDFARFGSRK